MRRNGRSKGSQRGIHIGFLFLGAGNIAPFVFFGFVHRLDSLFQAKVRKSTKKSHLAVIWVVITATHVNRFLGSLANNLDPLRVELVRAMDVVASY